MNEGPEIYFRSSAEDGIYQAKQYLDQGRRAKAQESLMDAKFWAKKCRGDYGPQLMAEIEQLQRSFYL